MTRHVPVSASEIVEDVLRAYELGITMVHLHARSPNTGKPTYSSFEYQRILRGIRKHAKDLILCVSTSGRDWKQFDKRAAPMMLHDEKPDMASLTLSSLNFNKQASWLDIC